MTPELWNIYLELQGVWAYGDTCPNYDVNDDDIHPIKVDFSTDGLKNVLLVGPGGRAEVVAWRKAAPNAEFHVLTNHQPEAAFLQNYADIHLGDIHDTPFHSRSFDVVYASQVMEHTFSPYIALMECRRILKDRGFLFFSVPSFRSKEGGKNATHINCLSVDLWSELLIRTGFVLHAMKISHGASEDPEIECYNFTGVAGPVQHPHVNIYAKLLQYKENFFKHQEARIPVAAVPSSEQVG